VVRVPGRALRTQAPWCAHQRWKLIHFWETPEEWALYDLHADPGEIHNVVDEPQHAELVAQLKQRITQLRAQTGDVDPPGDVPPRRETGKCPA